LQAELVAGASSESEKLDDLMSDLIEVAELDAGRREFTLERLRPLQVLNEARDRFCDEAAQKHIRIEVSHTVISRCAGGPARVALDSGQPAHQCLRYTPAEGEILLAAEEVKDFVKFTVRDTGRESRPIGWATSSTALIQTPNGHRSGPRAGAAAGGVAGRSNCGGEPLWPWNTFRFTIPVAVSSDIRHPVEVAELWQRSNWNASRNRQAPRVHRSGAGRGQDLPHAQRRLRMKHQQGIDVVIGLVESHGRKRPKIASATSRLFRSA